ncbi:Beta-soluble NSF attachment protein [Taenia solium]
MDENERRAREYLASAAKHPKGGFFRSLFSGGSDGTEERVALYERAANCFKMAHKWQEAGDAFVQAAELSASNKSQLDAATHYVNASVAYRKTDPNRAITCLTRAADIYIEMGRFTIAAKHHMTIAEIYEQDLANEAEACKHYERAADFYKGEESNSSARKCMLKVAHFYATSGQFEKAARIFEEAGVSSMDNKLLRYGAKEYLMKAVICDMNYDIVKGHNTLEKFEQDYPMFADSRECTLLKKVDEALSSENLETYTAAVKEYDSVTRLEPWMTEMLLKLKKALSNEEDIT